MERECKARGIMVEYKKGRRRGKRMRRRRRRRKKRTVYPAIKGKSHVLPAPHVQSWREWAQEEQHSLEEEAQNVHKV